MARVMRQGQVGQCGGGSLAVLKCIAHAADQQTVFNGVEPLRTFRVAGTHLVFAAIGVAEVSGLVQGLLWRNGFSVNVLLGIALAS